MKSIGFGLVVLRRHCIDCRYFVPWHNVYLTVEFLYFVIPRRSMVITLVLFICLSGNKEEQGLINLMLWVHILKSLSILDRSENIPFFRWCFVWGEPKNHLTYLPTYLTTTNLLITRKSHSQPST
ncbi:hypothetical protein GE21DRAFT_1084893 [Neurospora crassa]|nr:hypothetical protein GE21DRAFT_1084893 [Neurospora crassa]